jgi:N-acetylmuramoyl-L-alanine amidase
MGARGCARLVPRCRSCELVLNGRVGRPALKMDSFEEQFAPRHVGLMGTHFNKDAVATSTRGVVFPNHESPPDRRAATFVGRKAPSLLIRSVLLVTATAVLGHSVAASRGPKRRLAETAYYRAQRMRKSLRKYPNRPQAAYLRVVRAYELVYRLDPQCRYAPFALAAAADVYRQSGRRFADDQYYAKAIESYRFLIAQYPEFGFSREALFRIAEIYRKEIEDPEAARAAYRQYLKRYPRSANAADAALEIARINEELSAWKDSHLSRDRRSALANGDEHSRSIVEVTSIRRWLGPDYTRVVIQTGHDVKFNATHLQNPPRLIFDLDNTRLSPGLAHKTFPVGHGFLRRVRVAQFKPRVTRVVLDVAQIEDYSVFSLPHPFRLVIDIRGQNNGQGASLNLGSSGADSTPGPMPGPRRDRVGSLRSLTPDAMPTSDTESQPTAEPLVSVPNVSDAVPGIPPTLTRALGLKIRRIVIDPGHGGHDTGTLGPEGIEEKNVVLDVALRLRRLILHKLACQVVMTRSTDTFIPLEERTAMANQDGADLFISIHANASRDPAARGIETYYLNFTRNPEALAVAARENATSEQSVFELQSLIKKIALSEKLDESRDFAKVVDHQLLFHLNEDGDRQPDRGIKKAPFVVLIGANMPSILVEISFLTNPHDERLLESPHFRQEIAQALYDGIARYAESLGTIRVAQRSVHVPVERNRPDF